MRNSALRRQLADIWGIPKPTITKAICFTGDDGYITDYTMIKELCDKYSVPYTFAIQCNSINKPGFMSGFELTECANDSFISFALHCMDDTLMQDVSPDELQEIYNAWYQYMQNGNYIDTGYIAPILYNHGNITEAGISETVQYRTMAGATVNKGINYTPFTRFKLKRNGLFPSDNNYTIADAKADIETLKSSNKSGIVIFMTHSNTDTFDIAQLEELMIYAKESGIPVMHLSEAMNAIEPYEIPDRPVHNWVEQDITLYDGVCRLSAWNVTNPARLELNLGGSSVLRLARPIDVTGATYAKITGYTSGYYCKYAFYKADPTVYSNLISYSNFTSSVSGTNGNFTSEVVTIPSNAKYLVISGTNTGSGRNMVACQLDYFTEQNTLTYERPKPVNSAEDNETFFYEEVIDVQEPPTPLF